MEQILVSACLLGRPVRYDGTAKYRDDEILARWREQGRLVSVCPEVTGGLPVPRPPSEVSMAAAVGDPEAPRSTDPILRGAAVLDGHARVRTATGADVTAPFVRGAEQALEVAQRHGVRMAVLKEGSPSCGSSRIYDGTFTGTSVPGFGVTTALLSRHGIQVFNEDQLDQAATHLERLEATSSS